MFLLTSLFKFVIPFSGSLIQNFISRFTELSPNSFKNIFGEGFCNILSMSFTDCSKSSSASSTSLLYETPTETFVLTRLLLYDQFITFLVLNLH
jgi:hypothetical protein